MTGMKINIKKRNGMMSNIANTAVLKRREGAGNEDNIAGTKMSVEIESRYCKNSDTQEINNYNNNNNDISGNDNISGDINDNEEEESTEDDVENEDDNNNNNNEGTNTSDEISDNEEGVDDDAHCINNGIWSKNANTAVPRPRGVKEDAYRIEGTRSSVKDEEVDLYCQGSDDDKSTNDVFTMISEEHDDTNEEAAPSTSFEE
jgi:hypothetical protein